ncbi:hypothetical protein AXK60_09640 [Tsukamurella pseudospumae]|uniref:Uncharacterized protein n=1 Tax=Tsukamurella pseudospumae TaxID=239498 RepID=A0A138ABW7_9ACTN|nr:hypothetical protein AXK61_13675 [Tsukamurella pseudospumae]KXP07869.1 hypothetical protein AXK60_09640 [Tsukamurella pseudospumae]
MLQQRLQGAFLTIIGIAGLFGGVLFSIEAPRFTPVPVVFLTFWLVMVIVGKILFAGLGKLRETGVTAAPAAAQVRAAAAVAGIVVAVGMMGFAATTGVGAGVANAVCPGDATCPPGPGPTLTFDPPTQTPGGQQGNQGGQQTGGNTGATSPSPAGSGGDNGPGIQAQTPQFGSPGQQAPNIPGNEQPGQGNQGGQRPAQGNGQGQPNQSPAVQTTAPGGPRQTDNQQPGQQTQSGQPSSPTVTVTKTESQCAVPGAGNGAAGAPGNPGNNDSSNNGGSTGPDGGEKKDGAPSWAYLVGEVSALMAGRRGRKAGPLNPDGSAPTNDMTPNDQVDGENYKEWTTPDGKRTFILSENADAPSKYRFNINEVDRPDGGSVDVNDDGSLSTYDRDGNEVNRFTPWAYDTVTGQKIPTSYTRDGNDLIQTINRPEGNNNPILADPPGNDGPPPIDSSLPGRPDPASTMPTNELPDAERPTLQPPVSAPTESPSQSAAQRMIAGPMRDALAQARGEDNPTPSPLDSILQATGKTRSSSPLAPLESVAARVQDPDAPTDPMGPLLRQVEANTQPERSAISEVSDLIGAARQQILQNRVNPALDRLRRAQEDYQENPNNYLKKKVEEARADLAKAYAEIGSLPNIDGVTPARVTRLANGGFEFRRPDGAIVNIVAGRDGGIIASEDIPGGTLSTIFNADGSHETGLADQGAVYPMDGWVYDLVGIVPIGKLTSIGLRRGVEVAGGETAEQAMLKAIATAQAKAVAAGKQQAAQITVNNAAGLEAARWLERNFYKGADVDTARFKVPGLGVRRVDLLTPSGNAIEVKTGFTRLSAVQDQVAKDAALAAGNVPGFSGGVEWVFFKSVITGEGGPDPKLIAALNAANIPWRMM